MVLDSPRLSRRQRGGVIWAAPRGPLKLNVGEIHVWRANLDQHGGSLGALARMLDVEERRKAALFPLLRHRRRYIIARAALREILGRYLGVPPPGVMFRYGERGKPELGRGSLHFSVSHSGQVAVFAISGAGPVGIDVEQIRDGIDRTVARSFLSPEAARELDALAPHRRLQTFFKAWTRMEACTKACGWGIENGIRTLEKFLYPGPERLLSFTSAGSPDYAPDRCVHHICVHDISAHKGCAAALAAGTTRRPFRYWTWEADQCRYGALRLFPDEAASHTSCELTR
ncbi:MAG TPA: 4'-phosphopantetheinyl transferase superfamily protein [Bryobacterales bacterium]|jgi:4'-phosphopantetheinyl transferase|nr:4'-phosphopantetheinyl transferase superfamily protein [Bryobacterales bacterium]